MSGLRLQTGQRHGFTIVELLIVIVVIAILAAISVVAYTGIQARANDSQVRSAVAQIEKALKLYAIDYGTSLTGGYGSTAVAEGQPCIDGTTGFFGTGSYPCTTEDTLIAHELLPENFTTSLPANSYFGTQADGSRTVMMYGCGGSGRYSIYWTLRNPSTADSDSINTTLSTCSNNTTIRDTYGMRAGKVIQL